MVRLVEQLPKIKFRRHAGPKEWILFGLSILCAIFFIWFGAQIIILGNDASKTELFLLGITGVIGGIIVAANWHHWYVGFVLAGIGFYFFGRAAGIIHMPILGYILAVASWFAGALLLYITYPARPEPKP